MPMVHQSPVGPFREHLQLYVFVCIPCFGHVFTPYKKIAWSLLKYVLFQRPFLHLSALYMSTFLLATVNLSSTWSCV